MDAVYNQYAQEMHERFGFLASWLPSARVALGDVGVLVDRRFRKVTTLAALGVSFSADPPGNVADIDYSSAQAVQVTGETGADAGDLMSTTVTISFGRSGATFFQAGDTYEQKIADLHVLEAELRHRHDQGHWPSEYVVVSTVLQTGPTVIFVSNERDAQVGLRLSADTAGSAVPIADITVDLAVTKRSGLAVNLVAPRGATPLFGAVQLRKRLGRTAQLRFRGDGQEAGLVPVRWPSLATVPETQR